MKADEQKAPARADPSEPDSPPQRSYARRIDCDGSQAGRPGARSPEGENGRGTGRLRNPREDH